jgi:hypothetical protein
MSKYKILIKLFELNCVFVCCVYGDSIQAAVVVVAVAAACLLVSLCSGT